LFHEQNNLSAIGVVRTWGVHNTSIAESPTICVSIDGENWWANEATVWLERIWLDQTFINTASILKRNIEGKLLLPWRNIHHTVSPLK